MDHLLLDEQHDHIKALSISWLIWSCVGVDPFLFNKYFQGTLGNSSTTLHLLKHHIKPHWLQQCFYSFIVNKSPGPAPTKVTMGFTILCISDIFALYVSMF
jgi:hypothetical protein